MRSSCGTRFTRLPDRGFGNSNEDYLSEFYGVFDCDELQRARLQRMIDDAGPQGDGDLVRMLMSYARVLETGGRSATTQ